MLSLFSSAKPFVGQAAVHQRNAFESWTWLGPEAEVLLFGNDEGSEAVAAELGFRHFPEVATNEWGTPLLSDMFAQAQARAVHNVVCYVNADIILFGDFLDCVRRVSRWSSRFVMVGRRWDVDLEERIEFAEGWDAGVRQKCEREGVLSDPTAVDFFVFPRGMLPSLPPFAIGRPAWDNWLLKEILARDISLVDITAATQVVHQNHGYGHVAQARGAHWEGPEGDANLRMAHSDSATFNPGFYGVLSSTHVMRNGKIRRAWFGEHLSWRLNVWRARVLNSPVARRVRRTLWPLRQGVYLVRFVLLEARGHRAVWAAVLLVCRRRSTIRRRLLKNDNWVKLLRRSERVLAGRIRASGAAE
jgi:hypothetical protein